jgi:hypothetical protein
MHVTVNDLHSMKENLRHSCRRFLLVWQTDWEIFQCKTSNDGTSVAWKPHYVQSMMENLWHTCHKIPLVWQTDVEQKVHPEVQHDYTGAYVVSVNESPVFSVDDIDCIVDRLRSSSAPPSTIWVEARLNTIPVLPLFIFTCMTYNISVLYSR